MYSVKCGPSCPGLNVLTSSLVCWLDATVDSATRSGPFIKFNWPVTRYVKLWVAHAPGMSGTFSRPDCKGNSQLAIPAYNTARASHCIANPRWLGKRSQYFQRVRHLQFYVSGKRPMGDCHKSVPFVHIRVRYYSVENHRDNSDLVVKIDIFRPQVCAQQFVFQQARYTYNLKLAHQSGNNINIESVLLEAAQIILPVEDFPNENHGCHRISHHKDTCPWCDLFREIINIKMIRKYWL